MDIGMEGEIHDEENTLAFNRKMKGAKTKSFGEGLGDESELKKFVKETEERERRED